MPGCSVSKRLISLLMFTALLLLGACSGRMSTEAMKSKADYAWFQQRYTDAKPLYAELTERDPGNWQAQQRLGECLLIEGDASGARRALELAWVLRPGDEATADALAEAMYDYGDRTALFVFLREQTQTTQTPAAYLRLAYWAIECGDPDTARVAIQTALAVDDGDSVEPYLAGAALAQQIGAPDDAVLLLHKAYVIDPEDERVRTRLRELGAVPGPTMALPPDDLR